MWIWWEEFSLEKWFSISGREISKGNNAQKGETCVIWFSTGCSIDYMGYISIIAQLKNQSSHFYRMLWGLVGVYIFHSATCFQYHRRDVLGSITSRRLYSSAATVFYRISWVLVGVHLIRSATFFQENHQHDDLYLVALLQGYCILLLQISFIECCEYL